MLGWYYDLRKRAKIYILKKVGGVYRVVSYKRTPLTKEMIKIDDDEYLLDFAKCVLDKKGLPELRFIEGNADPVTIIEGSKTVNAKMLKKILDSNIYGKIIAGSREKYLSFLIILMGCALVGVTVFAIYTQMTLSNRIMELMTNLTRTDGGVIVG